MRILARLLALAALGVGALAVVAVAESRIGIRIAPDDAPAAHAAAAPRPTLAAVTKKLRPLPRPRPVPPGALGLADGPLAMSAPEPAVLAAGEYASVRFRLTGRAARGPLEAVAFARDGRHLERVGLRREGRDEWVADVRLPRPGAYRLVVDAGRRAVGADLFVAGEFAPRLFPDAEEVVRAGRRAFARLTAAGDELRVEVATRRRLLAAEAGEPLVAVRAGDGAYVAAPARGRALRFRPRFPGPGRYRVFVPFRTGGSERVVAFTHEVAR